VAACLRLRLRSVVLSPSGEERAAYGIGSRGERHVIPNGVTVERPWRSGVYVREHVEDEQFGSVAFTGVDARLRS